MKNLLYLFLLLWCYQSCLVAAQYHVKSICVTSGFVEQCSQLERENPNLRCVRVQDSIECAKLLRNGTSGFGIFSAESTLLLAALNYADLAILKELRHNDRSKYKSDFESVVIVKATHQNGIEGLKGLKYCHPGLYYDRSERWSERFLKHFERTILNPKIVCSDSYRSPAEIEVAAIAEHFGSACRPGSWSNNPEEDRTLKEKYPQLCELCTSETSPCEYAGNAHHTEAMRCLISKGDVAYVSLQEAQNFFAPISENAHLIGDYAYLCPNDTIQLMNDYSKPPCTWLAQPWPVIISNSGDSITLSESINRWNYGTSSWESIVKEMLTVENSTPLKTDIQKPVDLFFPYREVPYSEPLCSTQVTWCTSSFEEKEKCEVIQAAGVTTGIQPVISCSGPVAGPIACLKEVQEGRADFTSIDSNYGFIARHSYGLSAALYGETEKQAPIVVVVHADSNFKRFDDLRNAKACIAEYDGIASAAFINTGKTNGFLPKSFYNHSRLLSEFFGPSCVPGALDPAHGANDSRDSLCSLCPQSGHGAVSPVRPSTGSQSSTNTPLDSQVELNGDSLQNELDVLNNESKPNCYADLTNSFYGDKGALFCLNIKGDVAVLGLKHLNEHARALAIDPHKFQVICRNGTVADRTGFDVDPDCALATFVDSEIVVKPENPKKESIINAIKSLEKYLSHDPDMKMFNTFDGHTDLLFNNGTIGLSLYSEQDIDIAVKNYNDLFESLARGTAFQALATAHVLFATIFLTGFVSRMLQQ